MTNFFLRQISIGPMMNYAYLIGGSESTGAVVIDASWSADQIIKEAKENNRTIEAVLLTHTHYDHCNAVEALAEKISVPVYVHESEVTNLPNGINIKKTRPEDVINAAGLKIQCLHTPGHSPGSQCFLVDDVLFTGDTLFVDGCGRIDLPGSDPKAMISSLTHLSKMPDHIKVYPGHNYGASEVSTIGEQKQNNLYLAQILGR